MSTFLRERANGVADNVIAAILLWAGSAMLGFLAKFFALSLGVPPLWAYVVGVVAFLLIAMAVSLLLKPKSSRLPFPVAPVEVPAVEQNLSQTGIKIENNPHIEVKPEIHVHTSPAAQAQSEFESVRPAFKVTVQVTGQPGLVRLDVNLLRAAQPDEDTGVLFAVRAEFENLPSGKGKSVEVRDVWAHITYRDFDFLNVELARVASGCWIDQPIADVTFPVRVPRYLMLGAWHVDKGKQGVNEFRMFEYSRDLHRVVEKDVKILGPRVPFVKKNDQIAIAQRRIVIDVVLTSDGHHDDSCEYQFHLTIFGGDGTGHGIACVKQPSLS